MTLTDIINEVRRGFVYTSSMKGNNTSLVLTANLPRNNCAGAIPIPVTVPIKRGWNMSSPVSIATSKAPPRVKEMKDTFLASLESLLGLDNTPSERMFW